MIQITVFFLSRLAIAELVAVMHPHHHSSRLGWGPSLFNECNIYRDLMKLSAIALLASIAIATPIQKAELETTDVAVPETSEPILTPVGHQDESAEIPAPVVDEDSTASDVPEPAPNSEVTPTVDDTNTPIGEIPSPSESPTSDAPASEIEVAPKNGSECGRVGKVYFGQCRTKCKGYHKSFVDHHFHNYCVKADESSEKLECLCVGWHPDGGRYQCPPGQKNINLDFFGTVTSLMFWFWPQYECVKIE